MNPETVSPEFLREMPLFSGFNATDLSQISDIGGVVEFQPERLILEQGATSRDLWILLDGRCEVTRRADPHDAESKRVSLAHLEPPAHFGDMSFFSPSPHSADVRSQTAVRLLRIKHADYSDLVHDGVLAAYKLAFNITEALVRRLRRMDDWVAELAATDHEPTDPPRPEWQNFREKLFDRWTVV